MRTTIFNIYAILSLFSVAIYAAPLVMRDNPNLPKCPDPPLNPKFGIGPVCNP